MSPLAPCSSHFPVWNWFSYLNEVPSPGPLQVPSRPHNWFYSICLLIFISKHKLPIADIYDRLSYSRSSTIWMRKYMFIRILYNSSWFIVLAALCKALWWENSEIRNSDICKIISVYRLTPSPYHPLKDPFVMGYKAAKGRNHCPRPRSQCQLDSELGLYFLDAS